MVKKAGRGGHQPKTYMFSFTKHVLCNKFGMKFTAKFFLFFLFFKYSNLCFVIQTNAGKEHKDDSEKKLPAAKDKQRCHQTQRKDVNLGENVEKNKSKSRQNHAIKEMNVDRGQAVKEMSRQKFEAAKEGSLEQVKVTRRGKGRTEPLETQLPLPGPRRSKRIANQCKMQD